jgi:hypothetical protein
VLLLLLLRLAFRGHHRTAVVPSASRPLSTLATSLLTGCSDLGAPVEAGVVSRLLPLILVGLVEHVGASICARKIQQAVVVLTALGGGHVSTP